MTYLALIISAVWLLALTGITVFTYKELAHHKANCAIAPTSDTTAPSDNA